MGGSARIIALNAIAGMYRAMAMLVTLLGLAVVLAHTQKDTTPEVLLSQLPDGYSYQDTVDVTDPDYDAANLRGQDGLSAKLKAAHANEAKERRKADGLEGEMVLSSVGIQGGASAPEDPTSDNFDDLELVQVQDWTPSGQPGLAEDLRKKHKEEHQRKLKDDGLHGESVLSSAGMAHDSFEEDEDPAHIDLELVQDWHPQGQNLGGSNKAKARKQEKRELEGKADYMPPIKKDQAAEDKEDLFGMVDIDVKLKADHPDDELAKIGIIDTKKIHFRDGKKSTEKGWLSEDDIQLVQTQH